MWRQLAAHRIGAESEARPDTSNFFFFLSFVFLCTNPILANREESEVESAAGAARALRREEVDGESTAFVLSGALTDEDLGRTEENSAGEEDDRTVGEMFSGLMLRRLRGLRRNASAGASAFSDESVMPDVVFAARLTNPSPEEDGVEASVPLPAAQGLCRARPRICGALAGAGVAKASSARSFAVTMQGDADRAPAAAPDSSWSSRFSTSSNAANTWATSILHESAVRTRALLRRISQAPVTEHTGTRGHFAEHPRLRTLVCRQGVQYFVCLVRPRDRNAR